MSYRIHVSTSFEVSDDHREHARLITRLEPAASAMEEEIQAATGEQVKVHIAAKRIYAPKKNAIEVHPLSEAAE